MNKSNENLLGYLLNALDENGQREMEAYVAGSAEARDRLEALRRALEPLSADREEASPPPDLFYRTLGRVAEHASRRELPRAPAPSPVQINHRPPWRRVEFLVAASILIIALGSAASGLAHLRSSSGFAECRNNLRVFFAGLNAYHDEHRQFPDVKAEAPRDAAGMMVPMLVSAGVLDAGDVNIRCPGNSVGRTCPVTYEDAKDLSPGEFDKVAPRLMSCYAYSLGYFDQRGTYHAPHLRGSNDADVPLMSDRPPYGNDTGNSPNHGGTGQNVLFQDGHVDYMTVRHRGKDSDIFLNRDRTIGAGRDPQDACLGQSAARP
jgi:prepilin-type processing-associated H-X9-DG protein